MLPEKVEIGHYRALRDCSVTLVDSTVLVGPNGVGKSTFLYALRFFFEPQNVGDDDVQHGCEDDVRVTVTLGSLSPQELEIYADHLDAHGKLVVTKSGSPKSGAFYSVTGRKYPGFASLRALFDEKAGVFTPAYKQFVAEHPTLGLATPRSMDDCKAELQRWESEHPEDVVEAEVPFQFVGATKTRAVPSTRLVYVPAVHEAGEDFKGSRSPLRQMIEALVMPDVEEKPQLAELRERWNTEYQNVFPTGGTADLRDLSTRLSTAIQDFVPGATVDLRWGEYIPVVPVPEVESSVSEDGVPTQISMQGHGLQRAMIIALLQARDEQLRDAEPQSGDEYVSHILLLVEEPELYQHPPRARHFRRVLKKLATQPGKNCRFRVVSTTHSADFISLDDLESIRIVRKHANPHGVPHRRVSSVTLTEVAEALSLLPGGDRPTAATLQKNLHALDAALREAFFASAIVLTEGVSDVGMLSAEAERAGVDLEARGIVMSSTYWKGQLPLALTILELLKIKNYAIFDGDTSGELAENKRVLEALGTASTHIPKVGTLPTFVGDRYSVLTPKIEHVVLEEFGAAPFANAVAEARAFFGKADPMKNPVAARSVIQALFALGLRSHTLTNIVERLSALS
jgi:putative ATP-dependent endonuclease of OLD family